MNSINLNMFPSITKLKKLLQSLAVLDVIISPKWEDRYYSFNSQWDKDEQMASMRNGCGDDFFVHFTKHGCFIKGMAHESQLSSWNYDGQYEWKEILKQVPNIFMTSLNESAFSIDDISFCYWCESNESIWRKVDFPFDSLDLNDDIDGSDYLLECFNGNPETYQTYVNDYFEQDIKLYLIKQVYQHKPLTETLVKQINPEIGLSEIIDDVEKIGYSYVL